MLKKLAIFVSGGGSAMQSVIYSVKSGALKAQIALVVASREGIYAIERAKKENIPYIVYNKKDYADLSAMYEQIIRELTAAKTDYLVLAGYLNILTKIIVDAFPKRIINIHPSLIPKYCGMGYYGMRVHEAVIANREKISGATVHYVDEGADTGEIIAQETVPVYDTDTPETLRARVLELEHKLLPKTLIKLLRS